MNPPCGATKDPAAGCTCTGCEEIRTVKRRRDKLCKLGRGEYMTVAATETARRRLRAYYESGLSSTRLAVALDCSVSTVLRHLRGEDVRMRRSLFAKVMAYAAQPDGLEGVKRGGALLDGTGTRRRLRALNAEGFGSEFLGARMGVRGRYVSSVMRGDTNRVTYELKRDVARVYADLAGKDPVALGMVLNNVAGLRSGARKKGWVTSAWWDDDTIDDPRACTQPLPPPAMDDVAVQLALDGYPTDLTRQERGEVQRRLVLSLKARPMEYSGGAHGYQDDRVVRAARGLGVQTGQVVKNLGNYRTRMKEAA
jgi:hypothetical protein